MGSNMPPQTINDRAQATYNPFQSNNSQQQHVPNIFLDNYARQQQSPLRPTSQGKMTVTESYLHPSVSPMMGFTGNQTMQSDVDRLQREREDLLRSGCYTPDDPLIMELDRQIKVKQLGIA